MNNLRKAFLLSVCALWAVVTVSAQAIADKLPPAEAGRVVQAFAGKEGAFREALNSYSFKRDAKIQTIGFGGQVTGEYHRVSAFTFDDKGQRYEKIIFFPQPTLTEISVTPEDIDDMNGVNPFALEGGKIGLYNITYAGDERIDDLDLFVFDVAPKVMPVFKKSVERMFQGRVWVDKKDLQIVKSRGKGVPEDKNNKFPTVETYREQIDGKYWFPTYTYSNDQLEFASGQLVRMKVLVTYKDFKKFSSKVRIIEDGEVGPGVEDKTLPPTETPMPTAPKKPF